RGKHEKAALAKEVLVIAALYLGDTVIQTRDEVVAVAVQSIPNHAGPGLMIGIDEQAEELWSEQRSSTIRIGAADIDNRVIQRLLLVRSAELQRTGGIDVPRRLERGARRLYILTVIAGD